MLECDSGEGLVVASYYGHNLVRVTTGGEVVGVWSKRDGGLDWPSALAALPSGELVVRSEKRVHVFLPLVAPAVGHVSL